MLLCLPFFVPFLICYRSFFLSAGSQQVKARVSKIEELRAQFDRVDVDLSGEIDAAELSLAMVGAGQKDVGEAEAAELIDLVDKDGTGTLDFEEFVAMMTQIDIAINGGSEAAREERLNHAFDLVKLCMSA
jgi:hypothetical protein